MPYANWSSQCDIESQNFPSKKNFPLLGMAYINKGLFKADGE